MKTEPRAGAPASGKLVDLLRAPIEALRRELSPARPGADVRRCLEQQLGDVRERYVQSLPIAYEAPATTYLRLLELSAGYLEAASCAVQTTSERTLAAPPVAPTPVQELSSARTVRMGALVVLLIALLALLSTSWLAGVAFVMGLLLFLIELIPHLVKLRSEVAGLFGRWQPWKNAAVDSLLQGGQSPVQSGTGEGQGVASVHWDGERIATVLTDMAAVVDEGVAAWMERLQRPAAQAAPGRNGVDPELIRLLQELLGDSQHTDPRYLRERTRRIPDVLKAQGLHLLHYEELPTDAALDEYFQVFVDPSVVGVATILPAVVAADGVVAEGRLVIADHSILPGG